MNPITLGSSNAIRVAFREFLSKQLDLNMKTFDNRFRDSFDAGVVPRDVETLQRLLRDGSPMLPVIGFNSQAIRAALVFLILKETKCDVFVETGTYQAATCLLVAAHTDLTIKTCDLPQRAQQIAREIARAFPGRIELNQEDSREFLSKMLQPTLSCDKPFFYLDAHWEDDIPLLGEISIILEHQRNFIVMIDDFRVPHDPGFGFDEYRNGTLEWPYIEDTIRQSRRDVRVFYPSYPSRLETGASRGFVLIASADMGKVIESAFMPSCLLREG